MCRYTCGQDAEKQHQHVQWRAAISRQTASGLQVPLLSPLKKKDDGSNSVSSQSGCKDRARSYCRQVFPLWCFPMCEPAQCCCQNTFKSTTLEKKLSFFVFKSIFYFGLRITISISNQLQLFQYMTSKEAMFKTYINIQVSN